MGGFLCHSATRRNCKDEPHKGAGDNEKEKQNSATQRNRWHSEHVHKEMQRIQAQEGEFLDQQAQLYQSMALEHMDNYEKVYGKDKVKFWQCSFPTESYLNEDQTTRMYSTYMAQPTFLNFEDIVVEALCTSPGEVLNKDMWNLCDITALLIWSYAFDVVGVNGTLFSDNHLLPKL